MELHYFICEAHYEAELHYVKSVLTKLDLSPRPWKFFSHWRWWHRAHRHSPVLGHHAGDTASLQVSQLQLIPHLLTVVINQIWVVTLVELKQTGWPHTKHHQQNSVMLRPSLQILQKRLEQLIQYRNWHTVASRAHPVSCPLYAGAKLTAHVRLVLRLRTWGVIPWLNWTPVTITMLTEHEAWQQTQLCNCRFL
jgi:hypothetical protein